MSTETIEFVKKSSYLRVGADRVVRLKYAVTDRDSGHTLEYRDDLVYLHGGYGGAFPKVEQALEGKAVGESAAVDLDPEDGYGEHDPELVLGVAPDDIPEAARAVGTVLEGHGEDGTVLDFRVVSVDEQRVIVDGNHPLSGKRLNFVFEVMDVREASQAEIDAGYAFAPEASSDTVQ